MSALETMPAGVDVDQWARTIIRQARADAGGRHLPTYGSPNWSRLEAPQRWASAIVAAECWRYESNPDVIRERLTLELAVDAQERKRAEDQGYVDDARTWEAQWAWLTTGYGRGRRGTYGPEQALILGAWLRSDHVEHVVSEAA